MSANLNPYNMCGDEVGYIDHQSHGGKRSNRSSMSFSERSHAKCLSTAKVVSITGEIVGAIGWEDRSWFACPHLEPIKNVRCAEKRVPEKALEK